MPPISPEVYSRILLTSASDASRRMRRKRRPRAAAGKSPNFAEGGGIVLLRKLSSGKFFSSFVSLAAANQALEIE